MMYRAGFSGSRMLTCPNASTTPSCARMRLAATSRLSSVVSVSIPAFCANALLTNGPPASGAAASVPSVVRTKSRRVTPAIEGPIGQLLSSASGRLSRPFRYSEQVVRSVRLQPDLVAGPMFAALHHRNFRLLWLGQLISFSGSMMQQAAILWHVSLLVPPDRRGLALGIVGLVRVGPIVVFSLVSGVVADALDRRRLMMVTQISAALVATALAMLAFSGSSAVWPVYLLAALGSAAGAFDGPARHALIPNLVPPEHLPNALSLNQI